MNPALLSRESAIKPFVVTTPGAFDGLEGFFYKLDGSNQAVPITSAADIPDGIVLAVNNPGGLTGSEISGLPLGAGGGAVVRVKLGANVTDLRKDLQLRADGTAGPDAGTGARVIVARPLETGNTDELIQAVVLKPRALGAAVTLTSATTANATDLPTSQALANALKVDLIAVRAALLTAGLLA